jgi:hypothetical protein
MIDTSKRSVINLLAKKLEKNNFSWALTGSANHAIQGININPADIDIISDKFGVLEIVKLFSNHVEVYPKYTTADNITSYYAKLNIKNVYVDLFADIKNKFGDHLKNIHSQWRNNICIITTKDTFIPVLSLKYEIEIYRKLGNDSVAEILSMKTNMGWATPQRANL